MGVDSMPNLRMKRGMKKYWLWLIACCVLVAEAGPAQAHQYAALAPGSPSAQCLSPDLKETIRKKRESAHRTVDGEVEDPLDPDYFLGTWHLEWLAPDSPMTVAGEVTGTLMVRHVEGCYYEGDFDIKATDGQRKATLQLIYDLERRYLVWIENDSRGVRQVRVGPVGGDPGYYYTHFWEQPVINVKDTRVRLRGVLEIRSPIMFQVRQQFSVNADPYMNFGTMTFSKDAPQDAGPR